MRRGTPTERAASTNVLSLSLSTSPRVTRTKIGMSVKPKIRITLNKLLPTTAAITTTSRMYGTDSNRSTPVTIARSSLPPTYPAMSPSAMPSAAAMTTPPIATVSDTLVP